MHSPTSSVTCGRITRITSAGDRLTSISRGVVMGLFARYFELVTHEKWRLRRRAQVEALHSFVLEHRSDTFDSEWIRSKLALKRS